MRIKQFNYFPYAYKLLIPFLILVFFTITSIGYYSYSTSIRMMEETLETNINRTLDQISQNTTHQLNDFIKVTDSVFSDTRVQTAIAMNHDVRSASEHSINTVFPALHSAIKLSVNKVMLSMYIKNTDINEMYSYIDEEVDPLGRGSFYNIYHIQRLEEEDWFREWDNSSYHDKWIQIQNDSKHGNITNVRHFISFHSFNTLGYILLKVRLEDLFQSIDSFEVTEGTNLFVVNNKDSTIIYSRSAYEQDFFYEEDYSKDYLVVSRSLPKTEFTIFAVVDHGVFRTEAANIRNLTLLICFISFLAASLIAFFVSEYLSSRTRKIVQMAQSFHSGEFQRRIQIQGNDEFTYISNSLNRMADNVETLIKDGYLKSIQKKEAELTALQSQINPHFLYNTLSSINSLANLGEMEKLSQMVSGLAKFYRLTLNNGNIIISLKNEIDQVETYGKMQRIKYGNRFEFIKDIDVEIYDYDTVKLILQPFVENALKHGWFKGSITIRILGYLEGDNIILKIIDDGIGFHSPKNSTTQKPKGYGIRNVEERIKMQFGVNYGISIYSRTGIGTTVKIVIPKYKHLYHEVNTG